MPLFKREKDKMSLIRLSAFKNEKELQKLIENNLEVIFNCRFVATEFVTGNIHSGRIDTLALSEDNNPVIIEYKVVSSSDLINQSLFYLSWIKDHHGDFQVMVSRMLKDVEVDWSDIRVICIAPEYKKYDLHAVQVMGANIELWEYHYYEDGSFLLEEVFRKTSSNYENISMSEGVKNPIMVAAGKKAAITRKTGVYSLDEHLKKAEKEFHPIIQNLRTFILSLDDTIEETPKKFYIAYKIAQNFVCIEVYQKKIVLYLKINPKEFDSFEKNIRDVTSIGHFGTGDFEYTIKNEDDFEKSKEFINLAYKNIGG
ncbi:MAG: hypothetical protein A2Y33_12805 [Spirochaetes bacterium GWF1_51_8]|nr:MAG: hypothetical protein A2Y33_12805 [Spirochaetes bacterium GWF1_51_8]